MKCINKCISFCFQFIYCIFYPATYIGHYCNYVKLQLSVYNADVPYAEISTEQQIFFGSKTTITSKISSCPCPDGVEWQKSNDGKTFDCINISQPTYYGSSCNPESPLLLIPKVSPKDRLYYRLQLWNKIGYQYSNAVYIDATGSTL